MPNRIIKESICTSNEIDALTPEQEIFFYRVIVNCDDFGRMDARLSILRAKCFPLRVDKVKDRDIQRCLGALVEQNLIFIYSVDGKTYIQMTTWEKHQQVRAKRSKFPAPEAGELEKKTRISKPDDGVMHRQGEVIHVMHRQGEVIHKISSDINGNQTQSNVPENPIQSLSESLSESNPIQSNVQKKSYAQFVKMTPEEHQKLIDQFGQTATTRMIEILDNYKGANGKQYKSDYRAILNWVVKRYQEESGKPPPRADPITNWAEKRQKIKEGEF